MAESLQDRAAHSAETAFLSARASYQNNFSYENAWKFAQASFDWAEFARDNKQREEIALQGISAARKAINARDDAVAGHYYLAMNLGQLARTKSLGALKLVSEMERDFKLCLELEETFDFAGPARNLGLLYRDAPGWPTSIGNKTKARQYLLQAAKISGHYPENRLNLAESCWQWGDKPGALRALKELDEVLPAARKEFSGEIWENTWDDWDRRLARLRPKLSEGRRPQ